MKSGIAAASRERHGRLPLNFGMSAEFNCIYAMHMIAQASSTINPASSMRHGRFIHLLNVDSARVAYRSVRKQCHRMLAVKRGA